ncbi:hypothetical protein SASPL_132190 [Salvia splendens]|uniref:PUM-HD domain-containing protein n=1 Tax=Salvia splendens TaxID=180675 RepID=A0A8X8XCK0_SALSN|nr:hypothetical protein SASPL_132190 [Salvia splendens]
MKGDDDDELEMLLGKISPATEPFNLHSDAHRHQHQSSNHVDRGCGNGFRYGHASRVVHKRNSHGCGYDDGVELFERTYARESSSPVSGFPVKPTDGSSSSLFRGGARSLYGTGSHLEELKAFWPDENKLFGDFDLSRNFSKMYVTDEEEFPNGVQSFGDTFRCASRNGMNLVDGRDAFYSPNVVQLTHILPRCGEENVLQYQPSVPNGRTKVPPHVRVPQVGIDTFSSEDCLIIQGEGVNYGMDRGHKHLRGNNPRGLHHQKNAAEKTEERLLLNGCLGVTAVRDGYHSPRMVCPPSVPSKCSSLAEAQGFIHDIAKDHHGCRILQRIFEHGTSQDVQIIFNEIIDHVVELMVNPFGNYLMQKLLEVCNEEQTTHILLRLTEEQGELVRISLNTHGTRVVQKLIETLKTRQQVSLVISALEPGFLALIKDLNGNHVVQRCLQCFTKEDSKIVYHSWASAECISSLLCAFIFVGAAKYCLDIAMHQHGCCVLQRCITHSTGEFRENLVAEISANGLLLAQDAFGNYVVQFILELKIPSATSKLTRQFEGNYVHLSRQKFSSHVIEKCLVLIQDPHANYVVQTALRVTEGSVHSSLLNAIESYKMVSRNSPYSKRIFSHKFAVTRAQKGPDLLSILLKTALAQVFAYQKSVKKRNHSSSHLKHRIAGFV